MASKEQENPFKYLVLRFFAPSHELDPTNHMCKDVQEVKDILSSLPKENKREIYPLDKTVPLYSIKDLEAYDKANS